MSDNDVRRCIYVPERDLWVYEDTGQPTNVAERVEMVEYALSSESQTITLPEPATHPPGFRFAIRTPKGDKAWECVWEPSETEGNRAYWKRVGI